MPGGLEPPSIEEEQKAAENSSRRVVFVLEQVNLEVAKVGKVSSTKLHVVYETSSESTRCELLYSCLVPEVRVVQMSQGYQLLNCDDHASFLRRHGKDPAQYRPDICHQALLAILDSPLAKAGHLKVKLDFCKVPYLCPSTSKAGKQARKKFCHMQRMIIPGCGTC